jgi:hypothetical protein
MLKPAEIILRRERVKRESNGGDEPKQGTLEAHMETSQQNPLYTYYILIKMFKNIENKKHKIKL